MIIFSKKRFIITFGILAILFHIYFIVNATYTSTYKSNPITDTYTSISKFITLEETPDKIARDSEEIILRNIEQSVLNKQ